MKDYRTCNKNISLKGNKILYSMDNDISNIKILLTNIGINPKDELAIELKNYLNKNNLKLSMKNIYQFLKNKSIVSNIITANNDKINIVNIPLSNIKQFDANMNAKGYVSFTQDFLIKEFNDVTVNIKRDTETIISIICYDNDNSIVDIPIDVYNVVINDIEQCNV